MTWKCVIRLKKNWKDGENDVSRWFQPALIWFYLEMSHLKNEFYLVSLEPHYDPTHRTPNGL